MVELLEGLTFDDVLLKPKKSPIISRKDVSTKTKLTNKIFLNIPFVSSNMDSVTEAALSIALAREGGVGIIHRFMPIEQQVVEVLKVKRAESILVENPYTIGPETTMKELRELVDEQGVTSWLVVDDNRKLLGIITNRDMKFRNLDSSKVTEYMTPYKDLVTAPVGTPVEKANKILMEKRLEKLPIVDEKGLLQGLITTKDIDKRERYPQAAKDIRGKLLVGATVGVKSGFLERAKVLVAAEADFLCVDVAHGHSDLALNTIRAIKKDLGDVQIVAGNVATYEGALDLMSAGVDCVKIGVGPGSTCLTRIMTGAGVPQMTAIFDCVKASREMGIPVMADGGMRKPGDVVKALAAGAHTVMSGNIFAGTEETPGITILRYGRKQKIYRGSASFGSALTRKSRESKDDIIVDDYTPEGAEAIVPLKGSVSEVMKDFLGGLRSGLSYCGARTIEEMHKNAVFIKMSPAGLQESGAHDVQPV